MGKIGFIPANRALNSHKGDFGEVFIIAGSNVFSGAAVLTAEAAMRAGAGVVTLGVPDTIFQATISRIIPEIIVKNFGAVNGAFSKRAAKQIDRFIEVRRPSSIVFGPGVTVCPAVSEILCCIISKKQASVVIDADGLNALALSKISFNCGKKTVLTPHPGEAARLLKKDVKFVNSKRKESAIQIARKYGSICILKGHQSVISDGTRTVINRTGNPGMATAGSGDVLAGILGALMNQLPSVFDAAVFAAHIHGAAGDFAAKKLGQISMTASDIIKFLPDAFKKINKSAQSTGLF